MDNTILIMFLICCVVAAFCGGVAWASPKLKPKALAVAAIPAALAVWILSNEPKDFKQAQKIASRQYESITKN